MATRHETPWPHGRPTIICPVCHGSGLDSSRAWSHLTSRAALDDAARVDAIRCPACEGRGRQITEHALAQGHRVP